MDILKKCQSIWSSRLASYNKQIYLNMSDEIYYKDYHKIKIFFNMSQLLSQGIYDKPVQIVNI